MPSKPIGKTIALKSVRCPEPIAPWGGRHAQSYQVGSEGITSIEMNEFGVIYIEKAGQPALYITPGGFSGLELPAEVKA